MCISYLRHFRWGGKRLQKFYVFYVYYSLVALQEVGSHVIDTSQILKNAKKLNVLSAICGSCFTREVAKRNTTIADGEDKQSAAPNLTIEGNEEHLFRGTGAIALDTKDEIYDEEGTPIDAEVTIVIKVNKNSNSTVILKKLLLDKLKDLQVELNEKRDQQVQTK